MECFHKNRLEELFNVCVDALNQSMGLTKEDIIGDSRKEYIFWGRLFTAAELMSYSNDHDLVASMINRDRVTLRYYRTRLYDVVNYHPQSKELYKEFKEYVTTHFKTDEMKPEDKMSTIQRMNELEISRAKKKGELPSNILPDKINGKLMPSSLVEKTSLVYLMADIIYTMLFDMSVKMQRYGRDLRHNSKYHFNLMMQHKKQFQFHASKLSKDLECLVNTDEFFAYSDWLREVIELVYEKSGASDDAMVRIKALLFNLPSKKRDE